MSSPFAYLKAQTSKCHKAASKLTELYMQTNAISDSEYKETYKKMYDHYFDMESNSVLCEIRRMKKLKSVIQDEFLELMDVKPKKDKQWFVITIRPKDGKLNVIDFATRITYLHTHYRFIQESTYSFEQKGTNVEDLGKGMHCHIVAKVTQRSKGELLRSLKSALKDWIHSDFIHEDAGIDVTVASSPDDFINDYLVEYKSNDGHKEATHSWDELWRTGNSLKRLYRFEKTA